MVSREKIEKILEYAVRAPSTHNSQPWLFRIEDDKVHVFYNPKLILPEADKDGRDLYISIGCMLENLSIASMALGFRPSISMGPFEEKEKVALVSLEEGEGEQDVINEELFKTIPVRVNPRGVFEKESVSEEMVQKAKEISKLNAVNVDYITDTEKIKKIAGFTGQAMTEAYSRKPFRREMANWMNSNLSKKKEGLPGYSLNMPLVLSLFISTIIRNFNIGKILAQKNIGTISSAPMLIMCSSEDEKSNWVQVGRVAERLMLYFQSKGYQTSIYVGSIEIGDIYKEVQSSLGLAKRPQFIFAVGKIHGNHKITPRHSVKDKIVL